MKSIQEKANDRFKKTVIAKVTAALEKPVEVMSKIPGRNSGIRIGRISVRGTHYRVLEQNTEKNTKFAKCAKKGHNVAWVVSPDGEWYLVVDGVWTRKDAISDTGRILKDSAI